ncbi:MAG TPA: S41 family peptidase [Gemmataceae bacterium]|nr:S41 family peptidase [Gemmataceae bacterium]
MSRSITPLVALVWLSPVFAAPQERGPSPEALAAGDQFARQLGVIAQMVSREYARPVETADLYPAAITGLYDAARRPHPTTLLRELKAARTEAERLGIVQRARAELHGVPGLDENRDLVAAVSALTPVLDPHSVLVPSGVLNGTATGTAYGFEFDGEAQAVPEHGGRSGRRVVREGWEPIGSGAPPLPFRVLTVKPGSPGQQAGLRPGDIVRQIDGIAAEVHEATKAFAALHGAGPNKADPGVHHLTVDRAGRKEPLRLKLERTDFVPESLFGVTRKSDNTWDYWLDRDGRIAYVRLGAIENDSGERLSELLHDLGDIRGLVFDLRWCPGGYIDPATQIASTFLESGVVAKMKYRNPDRGESTTLRADAGLVRYKAGDYPLLVLVNVETIGGGELIAAALRDNGRAILAGTRTYGKASIQWPVSVPGLPGYSFKITGGTYTRPNGKNLQRFPDSKPDDDWGLRPDPGYEIPMSADLARKLKDLHLLYALRPGTSREAMELDDPEGDPQRLRALKLMRKLIEDRAKKEQ